MFDSAVRTADCCRRRSLRQPSDPEAAAASAADASVTCVADLAKSATRCTREPDCRDAGSRPPPLPRSSSPVLNRSARRAALCPKSDGSGAWRTVFAGRRRSLSIPVAGDAPSCAASVCFAPAGCRDASRRPPSFLLSALPVPKRTARLAAASAGLACSVSICATGGAPPHPRTPPPLALVQPRLRALLLYLPCHHRWLERRRRYPPAVCHRRVPAPLNRRQR